MSHLQLGTYVFPYGYLKALFGHLPSTSHCKHNIIVLDNSFEGSTSVCLVTKLMWLIPPCTPEVLWSYVYALRPWY